MTCRRVDYYSTFDLITYQLHRILPHPLIPSPLAERGKSGFLPASGPGTLQEALRSIGWGSIFMQLHIKLVLRKNYPKPYIPGFLTREKSGVSPILNKTK
jgi:hypothetical protein